MQWIDIKKEGNVGIMTMNCEEQNRFDRGFVSEIYRALDTIESDAGMKAVVLTGGSEKFFCTGLHLEFMGKLKPDELREFLAYFNNMLGRWCIFPRPVIAAINGHAIAGGAILAAHADYRLMREDRGWVSVPEVDINIPFLPGMIAAFKDMLPSASWRDMALTGKKFGAADAKKLGFIDDIYPKELLLPKAIELASFFAQKNTTTFSEIKKRNRAAVYRTIKEEDSKAIDGFFGAGK